MILKDQPACFPDSVLVKVSSKNDGTVLDRTKEVHAADALVNRSEFCKKVGVPYDHVVYQQIIYSDEQTYSKIARVDGNHVSSIVPGIKADALFTTTPGVGLFLPVADCQKRERWIPCSSRPYKSHRRRSQNVSIAHRWHGRSARA